MNKYDKKFATDKFYFEEMPFYKLMQRRVTEILLVCSKYHKFMLDEDGRIEEQLFQEYVELNLRYPPRFTHVSSSESALRKLKQKHFDLIIIMLNIGDYQALALSKKMKETYPYIPIVALTNNYAEFTLEISPEKLQSLNYLFAWQGNANIMLAIVKLIEDEMNAIHDINKIGVQAIILVEDSIRYYSSFLPAIYTVLFQQAREIMSEGLNEHAQTMRMRGRPKILLANTYEQAIELYDKFKENLLGIISDVTYQKDGVENKKAGILLCSVIREENPDIPILLQSSKIDHRDDAIQLGANFIHKHSKSMLSDLRDYIKVSYGFGAFLFKDPSTMEVIDQAKNLRQLQHKTQRISEESLFFHVQRNDFSRWLRARGLFSLATTFRERVVTDFNNIDALRKYMVDTIKNYRIHTGKGTIASFQKEHFDELSVFTRLGKGSLGGKARGLAFIDSFLKSRRLMYKYDEVEIAIPKTIVLSTDIFEQFMEENKLYEIAFSNASDEEILKAFLGGLLPSHIRADLEAILRVIHTPLAVRSSSLLEDSHFQPFAGVYSTYMIPNNAESFHTRYQHLCEAIRSVYASTYFQQSKDYILSTHNFVDEEKMGVIIQEVAGRKRSDAYFPTISGVARSLNFYPREQESMEEGIVNIGLGLGKTIVGGGISLRFAPKHPKKIMQLSDAETALKSTQKKFYAVDLSHDSFFPTVDEDQNLRELPLQFAVENLKIPGLFSTYEYKSGLLREGSFVEGEKVLTFASILKYSQFPIPEIISELLEVGQKEMSVPIEIEFAIEMEVDDDAPIEFKFLQIRPVVEGFEAADVEIEASEINNALIYAQNALGNGIYSELRNIIYIKPETFDASKTRTIQESIAKINQKFRESTEFYVLIGPGRWGSSDPWLGIPVKWTEISRAKVIVEASLDGFHVEPSQGSHFFQNITSFQIGYLTANVQLDNSIYDVEQLNKLESIYEDEYIRHVKLEKDLLIKIDGKKSEGLIVIP